MSLVISGVVGTGMAAAGITFGALGVGASALIGGLAAGTLANNYKQGKEANKLQEQAMRQSALSARNTAAQANQAQAKVQGKKPDVASLFAANQQAAAGGAGSTMLTGTAGVDPNQLSLGKSTLLGM